MPPGKVPGLTTRRFGVDRIKSPLSTQTRYSSLTKASGLPRCSSVSNVTHTSNCSGLKGRCIASARQHIMPSASCLPLVCATASRDLSHCTISEGSASDRIWPPYPVPQATSNIRLLRQNGAANAYLALCSASKLGGYFPSTKRSAMNSMVLPPDRGVRRIHSSSCNGGELLTPGFGPSRVRSPHPCRTPSDVARSQSSPRLAAVHSRLVPTHSCIRPPPPPAEVLGVRNC